MSTFYRVIKFGMVALHTRRRSSTVIQLNVTDTAQSASVPEPASIAFVGFGAAAIWLKRRRN